MADHFEEVINLRIAGLEARIDDETLAVKEHFDEQRKFITESLNNQTALLRLEFHTELGRVDRRLDGLDERVGRVEARLDRLEARLDRLEGRFEGLEGRFEGLEQKMDRRFDAVHLVLFDILSRLPPSAPAQP